VGGLLVFASVCYLASAFGIILLPKSKAIFDTIGLLSLTEAAFPLWLLIKGVRDPQPATTEAG
jgi:cyanate permease